MFAYMTGAIFDGDPVEVRYYCIGTVSDRGINSVEIRGLKKACEAYSLLLRDPKYNKYQKIKRPGRYRRTPRGVNWGSHIELDVVEEAEFAKVESECKDAAAAKADFDVHRARLCL